jgi:hypothetical protein
VDNAVVLLLQPEDERMAKSNKGPHYGHVQNRLTFDEAFVHITAYPNTVYHTAGNHTPFSAMATTVTKGERKGMKVIRFFSDGREVSRSYPDCWGHRTNCISTWIDCYTAAI